MSMRDQLNGLPRNDPRTTLRAMFTTWCKQHDYPIDISHLAMFIVAHGYDAYTPNSFRPFYQELTTWFNNECQQNLINRMHAWASGI